MKTTTSHNSLQGLVNNLLLKAVALILITFTIACGETKVPEPEADTLCYSSECWVSTNGKAVNLSEAEITALVEAQVEQVEEEERGVEMALRASLSI